MEINTNMLESINILLVDLLSSRFKVCGKEIGITAFAFLLVGGLEAEWTHIQFISTFI